MATAKTGSFYLTETVLLPTATASGGRVVGTIDLGAYVNVATGQAIAIDSVDFVTQIGTDFGGTISQVSAADSSLGTQLVDLNPGTEFVRADNQSLIASHRIDIDVGGNQATYAQDMFPDNYGSAGTLSEMFMVVNDTLYLTVGNDGAAIGSASVNCTVRIRARVVKLGSEDYNLKK